MTLEEAKEFYFAYDGFSFHMGREEPDKYNSFRMLDLPKELLSAWDEELLDQHFAHFATRPDRIWSDHMTILQIIRRQHCDTNKQLSRLLDEMEKWMDLDLFQTTLIVENMAGRNEPMNDGGVYVYCHYSHLTKRMNVAVNRLMELCLSRYEADERFKKTISRYKTAYDKWTAA